MLITRLLANQRLEQLFNLLIDSVHSIALDNCGTRQNIKGLKLMQHHLLAILALCATPIIANAQQYELIDISGGNLYSLAYAINNSGQIAGESSDGEINFAFRWDNLTGMTSLFLSDTLGFGINNEGQVTIPKGPMIWDAATGNTLLHSLESNPNGSCSAWDINDNNLVAGSCQDENSHQVAVAWNGSGYAIKINDIPQSDYATARSLNNNGQIIGRFKSGANYNGFVTNGSGEFTEIISPEGSAYPEAINEAGDVVGYGKAISQPQAFLWTKTNGFMNLGTLSGSSKSCALDINASGQIVGSSGQIYDCGESSSGGRAVIWENGILYDLNDLVVSGLSDGDSLNVAWGINDSGQITGIGRIGGKTTAYLLNPIEDPVQPNSCATTPFVLLSFTGLVGFCRRFGRSYKKCLH